MKTRKLTSGYCQISPRQDFQSVFCQTRNLKSCLGQVSSLFSVNLYFNLFQRRTPEYNTVRQKPSQFFPCAAELLKPKMFQCGPGGLAGSMFLDGLEDSKHFLVRNDVILTEGLSSDRQEHRYERRNIGVFAGTQVCAQERG